MPCFPNISSNLKKKNEFYEKSGAYGFFEKFYLAAIDFLDFRMYYMN